MIIDDERDLADLTAKFLLAREHIVYQAANNEAALKLLSEHPIDLIISDVIMSGIDGWQLAREVKKLYPDVRIQLVSGYQGNTQSVHADHDEDLLATILYKPVSRKTLLEKVDALLLEN